MTLPTQARIVIVGGGIAGCSTAYHLSLLGETDVLLLEQGKLTSGTTWHAAGLVGQMRPNRNMTRMSKYGIERYSKLEAETGLATGWKQCGSARGLTAPALRQRTIRHRRRDLGIERREMARSRSTAVSTFNARPANSDRRSRRSRHRALHGPPPDRRPRDRCRSTSPAPRAPRCMAPET